MAYADIGPFGANKYPTPHLDRMATEGRIMTDFYVTQAVCSASRAGLLTGCYNVRLGILGALGPSAKHGLHEDEITLAEICKQKGYATAIFGKWHLGHNDTKWHPNNQGFTHFHASNTLPTPKGARSGAILHTYTTQLIRTIKTLLPSATVIAGGGIFSHLDVREYHTAGADHFSLGTVCFNPLKLRRILNHYASY